MNPSTLISRRRGELMGLAALLIVVYHTRIALPIPLWRHVITRNGNMAVDFFAMLSGFGCVYALKKDGDFSRFYRRRLEKLLPVYYLVLALMYAIVGVPSLASLASSVLPMNVWTGEPGGSWYVGASLFFYLIVPVAMAWLDRSRQPALAFALMLFIAALVIPCATRQTDWTLATMRLTSLICGVGLGTAAHGNLKRNGWAAIWVTIALLYGLGTALMRHPTTLSAAPIDIITENQASYLQKGLRAPLWLVVLATVLEGVDRVPFLRWINVSLRHVGRHSLDLYLGHELVEAFAVTCLGLSGRSRVIAMLLLSYPVALALALAVKGLKRVGTSLKDRRNA